MKVKFVLNTEPIEDFKGRYWVSPEDSRKLAERRALERAPDDAARVLLIQRLFLHKGSREALEQLAKIPLRPQ